jgi:cytochrome o ubiquinol oxidase subunit 2
MAKSNQPRKIVLLLALLGIVAFGITLAYFLGGTDVALFNPKGAVANEQYQLLVVSTLVMLGFGLPVILTIYFFAWKYREGNQRAARDPATSNSKALLLFAWGGPLVTVIILASLMLPATQRLQPQSAIKADNDQITVQVVSLNWKWLFIYPEHGVASVNFTQIPVDTPVRFELTADGAPMSSFWIPHLGGMLYSMTGHVNPLNLVADTIGDYPGKTAEINGNGYAGMTFTARVSSQKDFDAWVAETKLSSSSLTEAEYQRLLAPSENVKPAFYKNPNPGLFKRIVSKYSEGHQYGSEYEGHGSH